MVLCVSFIFSLSNPFAFLLYISNKKRTPYKKCSYSFNVLHHHNLSHILSYNRKWHRLCSETMPPLRKIERRIAYEKTIQKWVKDVIMVCVFVECVWVWKKYKCLCYLHFFHDTILAHFYLKVKFIIISYISHRRQALASTGFKSDEKNYKKVDIFVRVYRNFINGSGTRSGRDGGIGSGTRINLNGCDTEKYRKWWYKISKWCYTKNVTEIEVNRKL